MKLYSSYFLPTYINVKSIIKHCWIQYYYVREFNFDKKYYYIPLYLYKQRVIWISWTFRIIFRNQTSANAFPPIYIWETPGRSYRETGALAKHVYSIKIFAILANRRSESARRRAASAVPGTITTTPRARNRETGICQHTMPRFSSSATYLCV